MRLGSLATLESLFSGYSRSVGSLPLMSSTNSFAKLGGAKRTISALSLAALLAISLTGCGATGSEAPTRNIKKVTDGAEGDSGAVKVRDLLIVAQPDGSGALVGTFLNDAADDQLVGITANGIPLASTLPLPMIVNKPVIFSGDSATAIGSFPGLNQTAGNRVQVVVTFATAAPLTLNVIVRDKTDYFANVGNAVASASPSPSSSK